MPVIIGRRELIGALCGAAVWPLSARAQVGERKYTIGMFSAGNENAVNPALNLAWRPALARTISVANLTPWGTMRG